MKLVSYGERGKERTGLVWGDKIVDLNRASEAVAELSCIPAEMICFLEGAWREQICQVREHIEELLEKSEVVCDISEVRLGAPVPRPSKLICLGLNYRDHAEESGQPLPEVPVLFSKASSAVIGPRDEVILPQESQKVDWEVELAIVIGKEAKKVSAQEALEYVAGYTVFNDVSARDIQSAVSQWHRGKSFDTFAPVGPWIVTPDDIENPHELDVRCLINGEEMQSSNTANLIFKVPETIEFISRGMTLYPGDIISTGTPGGVGFSKSPPRFLKPGDEMMTEIDRIGQLRNMIVAEEGR